MFSNQDIDYSLNRPCRSLSAVTPSSSKSSSKPTSPTDDDGGNNMDGGWDDDEDYMDTSSSFASHRFLVGSAIPSVSKLSDSNGDDGNLNRQHSIIEEDDEERTNRLYLIQYHEDSHELTQESSWVHPAGEVWAMACHPTRGDWVATCGGGAIFSANMSYEDEAKTSNAPLTKFQTTLWRVPDSNATDNDDDDSFNLPDDEPRQRTESSTSALTSSSRLDPVVTIPHGQIKSPSSSTSGWEQRVGQILWNPLLSPSNSSGDALYDLAETASNDGGGNLLTVGWDAQSPISLWDISSLSDVKEVWSTHGSGISSSRQQGRNRFGRLAPMSSSLPRRVSWDPHNTHHILATSGVDVVAYDMRSPASSSGGLGIIRSAHRYGVADVCHNHSQSNVVVTAGMDGVMKFWDLRMHLSNLPDNLDPISNNSVNVDNSATMPPPLLKAVRGGHSHWTTRAMYNPFYDQLVLSGGSDGIANLWRISSCSSAPLLELDDDEEDDDNSGGESYGDNEIEGEDDDNDAGDGDDVYDREKSIQDTQPTHKSDDGGDDNEFVKEDKGKTSGNESSAHDIRVTRFECSDVTADLAWSTSDPWIYATLSYDGAIAVHHVPSKEKYKILL